MSDKTPARGVALAGRAAATLADAASIPFEGGSVEFPATTIHRAFGVGVGDNGEQRLEGSKSISCGLLVLDETSMVDARMLALILERSEFRHLALVGDPDQLPPIGAGAPFADFIAQGLAPVTRLAGNYRAETRGVHALTTTVKTLAQDISPPSLSGFAKLGGFAFRDVARDQRAKFVGDLWADFIRRGVSPHEVAILYPKQAGEDGLRKLNASVRAALARSSPIEAGDLLLVTENNYRAQSPDGREITIMNGERCEVVAVGRDFIDLRFPASRVEDERIARVLHEGVAMPEGFAFGYAMSVHKAQGSQFQHVIVVTAAADRFVQRPSLYTAISRARQSLTIVGDEDEFWSAAIKDAPRRVTLLSMFGLNGD